MTFRFLFKYQISVIAFVQFILLSFLNIANALNSIVTTCRRDGSECISNVMPSIIFFILIATWFGFVWVLAYAAQERRNRWLTLGLIGAELLIAMVAYFNAKHHPDLLSLITSLVDLILAFWVIILAIRLLRAKGGRVVAKQRTSGSGRARRRKN